MPRNVQDFKGHPYYALERHLRRNEVIHPKQGVGRINIGTSAATRFETVYRRSDVHIVRSADKWFRLGRQLKVGFVSLMTFAGSSRRSVGRRAASETCPSATSSRSRIHFGPRYRSCANRVVRPIPNRTLYTRSSSQWTHPQEWLWKPRCLRAFYDSAWRCACPRT